jgi:hypothetical protein
MNKPLPDEIMTGENIYFRERLKSSDIAKKRLVSPHRIPWGARIWNPPG